MAIALLVAACQPNQAPTIESLPLRPEVRPHFEWDEDTEHMLAALQTASEANARPCDSQGVHRATSLEWMRWIQRASLNSTHESPSRGLLNIFIGSGLKDGQRTCRAARQGGRMVQVAVSRIDNPEVWRRLEAMQTGLVIPDAETERRR